VVQFNCLSRRCLCHIGLTLLPRTHRHTLVIDTRPLIGTLGRAACETLAHGACGTQLTWPTIPVCMGTYIPLLPLISQLLFRVMKHKKKLEIFFISLLSNVTVNHIGLVVTIGPHLLTMPVFIILARRLVLMHTVVIIIMIFINHLPNLPLITTILCFDSPKFPFPLFLARLAHMPISNGR